MNTPKPRPRRWWLWLAGIVVLAIGLFGGSLWLEAYMARKAWTDACAEADRLDPGWRWQDLLTARPVENGGATRRVAEISECMPSRWPDWPTLLKDGDLPPVPAEPPKPLPDDDLPPAIPDLPTPTSEERRKEFGESAEGLSSNVEPVYLMSAGHSAVLRIALSSVNEAMKLTEGLQELPTGRVSPARTTTMLGNVFPSYLHDARAVAHMLRMHSRLSCQDGDIDSAMLDIRRMLAVSRVGAAEPGMIHQLVQMAIRNVTVASLERVLSQSEPSPATLATLQRAIMAELPGSLILDALRGERAFTEDTMRALDDGRLEWDILHKFDDIPKVTGQERIDRWIYRARGRGSWTKPKSAAELRRLTFLIEIAKESPDGLRSRADAIAAFPNGNSPEMQASIAGYNRFIMGERRSRALLTSAATALAAERFRRDNGRWPASLNELVTAKLLAVAPLDPFDGQPLRMRRLSDGLVIYSVGQDLNDDGGEVWVDPAAGAQPKDLGVRLWDVALRRQKPGR